MEREKTVEKPNAQKNLVMAPLNRSADETSEALESDSRLQVSRMRIRGRGQPALWEEHDTSKGRDFDTGGSQICGGRCEVEMGRVSFSSNASLHL